MASSSKSSSTRLALLLRLSLLCAVALLISPAWSLTCSSQKFKNNELYAHCLDLPTLSSYLHWTYDSSNSSISVAFIAPPPSSSGWISWAINPTQPRMLGAQALVAFKHSNGSMVVQTYNIQSYAIKESELKLQVWDKSAEYSDGVIRLFAKMKVPSNSEKVNQVWQVGPVTGDVPERHDMQAPNLNAVDTLSLSGAQPGTTPTGVDSRTKKKNIHGVLNAVSWGILFPMGVIISRYLRTFKSADPAWFYLHVTCQVSAYAIGVAGWGTGMKLGSESKGFQYTGHRNIGITLFCFATVQLFALFLRPKKDHKYRFYWNIYHHGLGYAILVLGILNVFKGLDILEPEKKWKSAYIIVIGVLGAIALLLEAITWVVVLRRKSRKSTKPYDGFNNGQGRQQQPLAI